MLPVKWHLLPGVTEVPLSTMPEPLLEVSIIIEIILLSRAAGFSVVYPGPVAKLIQLSGIVVLELLLMLLNLSGIIAKQLKVLASASGTKYNQ